MCTSNNGGKGDEGAAGAQEVGSEVRLRLGEKAPPPKLGSAGQPCPPCSEVAEGSLLCPAGEKGAGGGWPECNGGWGVAMTLIHVVFVPRNHLHLLLNPWFTSFLMFFHKIFSSFIAVCG